MIYRDIFSVHVIQNAYKSYRVSFLGGEIELRIVELSPVRDKFRCRAIAHTVCTIYC